jgi:hypothetical protein
LNRGGENVYFLSFDDNRFVLDVMHLIPDEIDNRLDAQLDGVCDQRDGDGASSTKSPHAQRRPRFGLALRAVLA